MSENNVKITYDYPEEIQKFAEIQPPVVMLERPYIDDQLKEAKKGWTSKKPIIIWCPTGCGKTSFVLSSIKTNKNILIVENRNLLLFDIRRKIAKETGEGKFLSEIGINRCEKFGNIYVVSYQSLERFLNENNNVKFDTVYFDEFHFLLSDAEFSACTGSILRLIPERFGNSKRIYISATMDQVLPYIIYVELGPHYYYSAVDGYLYYKPHLDQLGRAYVPTFACWNGRTQKCTAAYHEEDVPMPLIYKMEPDYSKVNLVFFYDNELLFESLKESDTKTIIFVNSKKQGYKLKEYFGNENVLYLDAEIVDEESELISELLNMESFYEKILATTSVFCNGNNIKDPRVKNVVIFSIYPMEILQMKGRRRINGEKDGITLFLHIPKLNEIEYILRNLWEFYYKIQEASSNEQKLNSIILNRRSEIDEKIVKVTNLSNGKYKINELTKDVIIMKIGYLEQIKEIIKNDGIEGYCRFISSSLFGKEFSDEMIFKPNYADKKAELCALLDSYLDKNMNEKEFEDFSKIITEKRIELFGKSRSDNTGSNRKSPGIQALNNRFKELELPYEVQKTEDGYILDKTEI